MMPFPITLAQRDLNSGNQLHFLTTITITLSAPYLLLQNLNDDDDDDDEKEIVWMRRYA